MHLEYKKDTLHPSHANLPLAEIQSALLAGGIFVEPMSCRHKWDKRDCVLCNLGQKANQS